MREHDVERREVASTIEQLQQNAIGNPELQFHLLLETLDPASQRTYAKEIQENVDGRYNSWGMRECIDFLGGPPELPRINDLLESVSDSDEKLCCAEFTIGWRLLQDPDRREEAIEHLQACIGTDAWYLFNYHWAKAYLHKLKDPRWPNWSQGE